MQHLHFWIYNKEQQFETFREGMEKLLLVKELQHDVENYWEYMFGHSQKFSCDINVSRPNEWQMKDLPKEIPLHVIFYDCNPSYTDQIGNELNFYFKLPVYQGIVFKIPDSNYGRRFQKMHTYNKIDFSGMLKL